MHAIIRDGVFLIVLKAATILSLADRFVLFD